MPARTAVRRLRQQGRKVGYVNLRWFRPFPTQELRECLGRFRAVGVIDRDFAHGSPDCGGILFMKSLLPLPLHDGPAVICIMGGLGGRDISINDCITMYDRTSNPSVAQRETRSSPGSGCGNKVRVLSDQGGGTSMGTMLPVIDFERIQEGSRRPARGVLYLRAPDLPGLRVGHGDARFLQSLRSPDGLPREPPDACM